MKYYEQKLIREGKPYPTREERINVAYRNIILSNPNVTRKTIADAVAELDEWGWL